MRQHSAVRRAAQGVHLQRNRHPSGYARAALARLSRSDLQGLALVRLDDARSLLAADRWDGAYYLAGYAAECGLKACIAAQTRQYDFPDREL